MASDKNSIREFARHLTMVIFVNLIVALLLVDAYFADTPSSRLKAGVRILLAFVAMGLAVNEIKRIWKNVKHPGYYFLPTSLLFLVFNMQRRTVNAEPETARLKEIIATWPDPSIGIIADILDPERQEESLTDILSQMDSMRDCRLATITDRFRHYMGEMLESVDDNGNYHLFKKVMLRLSSYGPKKYRQTYRRFLKLLSDVFEPSLWADFDTQFRMDMMEPLRNAITQADRPHASGVRNIVEKIMADGEDEHRIANSVAAALLQLDWTERRDICRIIFDESVKRAFRFPRNFGIDFLNLLSRLEHRVFWLDIPSLRSMLEESLGHEAEGLINSNAQVYDELCSKVLAPLEDPACNGVTNARVFRRLKGDDGKVTIECISPDGETCSCEGESLSFRGVYSRNCRKKVGEKLAMNVIPIREVKRPFSVKASIAPLHSYESESQGPGRGAFFEEAEPSVVRGLYEYVSTKE
ncbi:MAG: hypothetical protein PVJ86_01580 [Phycisphaerales bacterium]